MRKEIERLHRAEREAAQNKDWPKAMELANKRLALMAQRQAEGFRGRAA